MKKKIGFFLLTGIAALTFAGCNKDVKNPPQQIPGSIDTTAYLQLTVSGAQLTGEQLYAVVSIESKNGEPVVTNKKITLDDIQGTAKTDKIELSKGEFKLSKFIVVKASDTAVYATPKVNTTKASQVNNPLALAFAVTENGINNAAVQVLKVTETDGPELFGYSTDDFGYHTYVNLKVKLKISVGQVVYDSLPGKLVIDATNNEGGHWTREIDMKRGITALRVPQNYADFKFKVSKWNTVAQRTFSLTELQPDMVIALETTRQPKRLAEEASFIENSAGLVADSRTEYFYTGTNRLSEIKNYQKSTTVSGLPLTNVYKFVYTTNQLDSILRFDANNLSTGYTAFFYENGRVSNISNKSYDQHTGAAIEYVGAGENEVISVDYLFHNGNTMNYKIIARNGNRISDQAQSSTGGSEGGNYEYDDNINPKHQLGWDDLYFLNYSKNNLMIEQKGYSGGYPTVIPYKYEYAYDNDGYPAEVYISYKGFTSQQHLYRIKKVYTYQ